MNEALERRLRQLRSRAAVRAWAYRQRRHAHGVWGRLRRVLADARAAWAIPAAEARRLVDEGFPAAPVGGELEPPRLVVFAPASRIARVAGARAVELRLGTDLLAAESLALEPFGPGPAGSSPGSRTADTPGSGPS